MVHQQLCVKIDICTRLEENYSPAWLLVISWLRSYLPEVGEEHYFCNIVVHICEIDSQHAMRKGETTWQPRLVERDYG